MDQVEPHSSRFVVLTIRPLFCCCCYCSGGTSSRGGGGGRSPSHVNDESGASHLRVPSARRKTFRRQRSFDISGGGLKGGDSSNTDSSEGDSSCDSWRRPATSMVNLRQPGATATDDKSQQLAKENRKCLLSTTSSSVTIVADRLQTDNGKCPRKTTD